MILTWRWPPTLVLRRMLREMGEEYGSSEKGLNTIGSAGGGGE